MTDDKFDVISINCNRVMLHVHTSAAALLLDVDSVVITYQLQHCGHEKEVDANPEMSNKVKN